MRMRRLVLILFVGTLSLFFHSTAHCLERENQDIQLPFRFEGLDNKDLFVRQTGQTFEVKAAIAALTRLIPHGKEYVSIVDSVSGYEIKDTISKKVWVGEAPIYVSSNPRSIRELAGKNKLRNTFDISFAQDWYFAGQPSHRPKHEFTREETGHGVIKIMPAWQGFTLEHLPVNCNAGLPLIFSLDVKAPRGGTIEITISEAKDEEPKIIKREYSLASNKWERVSIGVKPASYTKYYVSIKCPGNQLTFLSRPALREDDSTEHVAIPAQAAIRIDKENGLYHAEESVGLYWEALFGRGETFKIYIRVYDLFGRVQYTSSETHKNNEGHAKGFIRLNKLPMGCYKAQLLIDNKKGDLVCSAEKLLHVTPRFSRQGRTAIESSTDAIYLDIARRLGFKWFHILDHWDYLVSWRSVERQEGVFELKKDSMRHLAEDMGFSIVAVLGKPPEWARGYFPGGTTEKWERYVRQVVSAYKPWVSHWQVSDETYWYKFTPDDYARLVRIVHKIVKELQPNGKVIAELTTDKKLIDRWSQLQPLDFFDYAGYHSYRAHHDIDEVLYQDPFYEYTSADKRIHLLTTGSRATIDYFRKSGIRHPIFGSGSSLPTSTTYNVAETESRLRLYDPIDAVEREIKYKTVYHALGIDYQTWYCFMHRLRQDLKYRNAPLELDMVPKPVIVATAVFNHIVSEKHVVKQANLTRRFKQVVFTDGSTEVMVCWASEGGLIIDKRKGTNAQYCDAFGRIIHSDTVIVRDIPIYILGEDIANQISIRMLA